MKPDDIINDDQIDSLLRDVEVPGNLKDRLRTIPSSVDQSGEIILKTTGSTSGWMKPILAFALAATLLAIAAFFAWPLIMGNDDPINGTDVAKTGETKLEPGGTLVSPEKLEPEVKSSLVALELEAIVQTQHDIDATLHEMEMLVLREKLARLSNTTSRISLAPKEYQSMVFAIADQTILDLGGSDEIVKRDMTYVINRYPNTRGAEIAQEFLDTTNQQPNEFN